MAEQDVGTWFPGGLYVPLITPLTDSGAVCMASLARLIEYVRRDVIGLVVALSSGEGWRLPDRQWTDMVTASVRRARGLRVIAGIERASTAEVAALAASAVQIGADAIAITTPFGPDVCQAAMYRHVADVGAAADIPVIFYNEPMISGNVTEPGTIMRICELPFVIGVKDSSGDPEVIRALLAAGRPGVAILQGAEEHIGDPVGVDGLIVSLANIEPALCARAFHSPDPVTLAMAGKAYERYGLHRDDWYQAIKYELLGRGVIVTDRLVC